MDKINGLTFKQMLRSASNNLNNEKARVDALNVFPVPDGDTGTNMSMTFTNGVNEALNNGSENLSAVAKSLSRGLLMGARGNSGVILSQIFRGFYQYVDGKEEIDVKDLSLAMFNGSKVAYKAVMRPVEGTILTVIREASEYAKIHVENQPECTIEQYLDVLVNEAKVSLDHTPELLPVLKEVGVVDSGGTGLLCVLEGFKAFVDGNPIEANQGQDNVDASNQMELENEGFGYCTEFIVRLDENSIKIFNEEKLRTKLAKLGESIVVVQDEDIVKVHVHTLTPGDALNLAQRYGEFVKIKIENMQEQHNNLTSGAKDPSSVNSILNTTVNTEKKDYAIISVCAGEGLKKLFNECRADYIISGGQTMNPSCEDFVETIKKINAKHIFILPNNSNIIMAAKQAASVMEEQDIHVFETKSIPQGISACIMFNPECDKETNIEEMNAAIAHVKSGQVTYAIKDTTYEGLEIKANDFMGILEKDIVVNGKDKILTTCDLLEKMIDEDSEIVTLIQGEDATDEEIAKINEYIEENFNVEVDNQFGNQPVYSFIIGVE